jgi:hypothetical protein
MAERRPSFGEMLLVIATALGGVLVYLSDLTKEWPSLARWALLITVVVFLGCYLYYFNVLCGSSEEPGSDENSEYWGLRQSLELSGSFNRAYVTALSWALDKVDGFFGDAKPHARSMFARRLRIQTAGPTWTAYSYDQCLLLALVYPLATMFAIWIVFGHVGVAERALGLRAAGPEDTPLWRVGGGVSFVATAFAFRRILYKSNRLTASFLERYCSCRIDCTLDR